MEQPKPPIEKEAPKFTDYVGMQARMLLSATNLDPVIPLNITADEAKASLANTTEINHSVHHVSELIQECSAEARLKANEGKSYDEAMQIWQQNVARIVTAHGAKHQRVFAKLGWSDTSHFTQANAKALYDRFTDQNTTQSLVEKFVKETIGLYQEIDSTGATLVNAKEFEADLTSWQWVAGIFGAEEAEMATNLLKGYLHSLLKQRRESFAKEAPAKVNALSPREHHLLQKLSAKQKLAPPRPKPPAPPKPDTLKPPKPDTLPRGSSVEAMFVSLTEPVDKTQPYYVDSVPKSLASLNLPPLYDELKILEPFFVGATEAGRPVMAPNPVAAPWDRALRVENPDSRYIQGEALTHNDSGLVALCAASAENPQEQARLYYLLADLVIDLHSKDSEHIKKWLDAQFRQTAPSGMFENTFGLIQRHGLERKREIVASMPTRSRAEIDIRERTIRANTLTFNNPEQDKRIWTHRVGELQQALKTGKLEPHHLRWIEFLSHSVDINQVFHLMRGAKDDLIEISLENHVKSIVEARPEFEISYAEAMAPQAQTDRDLYYTNQVAFRDWISLARKKVKEGTKTSAGWYNNTNITNLDGTTRKLTLNTLPGENGWFSSGAFTEMANAYGIPMGLFIPGGHAMGLLKVLSHTEKDGKASVELLVYNPMTGVEEVDIARDIRQKNPNALVDVVDDDVFNVIKITFDDTAPHWCDNLITLGLYMSQPGLALLKRGEFDLSLQGDPLLAANEALAMAKSGAYQLGGDVYNCIPYSFLVSMIRAAAKYRPDDPAMPPEFRAMYARGLNNFAQDWQLPRIQPDGTMISLPFTILTRDDLQAADSSDTVRAEVSKTPEQLTLSQALDQAKGAYERLQKAATQEERAAAQGEYSSLYYLIAPMETVLLCNFFHVNVDDVLNNFKDPAGINLGYNALYAFRDAFLLYLMGDVDNMDDLIKKMDDFAKVINGPPTTTLQDLRNFHNSKLNTKVGI